MPDSPGAVVSRSVPHHVRLLTDQTRTLYPHTRPSDAASARISLPSPRTAVVAASSCKAAVPDIYGVSNAPTTPKAGPKITDHALRQGRVA